MAERKPFHEIIVNRFETFGRSLLDEIPELKGISVALTYDNGLEETQPKFIAFSSEANPLLHARIARTTALMLQAQMENISDDIGRAVVTLNKLQEEVNAKRRELAENSAGEAQSSDTGDINSPGTT